jgi:hypothetical protein
MPQAKSDLPHGTLDLLILKVVANGRDATFYKLTTKGRAHMAAEEASWRRLTQAIGLILKSAEGEAS